MNEKRFTLDELYCYVIQDNKKRLTDKQVVDLLNEQQAIIDQLNLAIDDLLSHTSCDEIKKENEQLRKQVAECKMILRQHEFAKQEGFE